MKKRERIEKMFSSFMIVDDRADLLDRGWETDRRLQKSIMGHLKTNESVSEEDWAQYWLQQVRGNVANPLAKHHLSAYLEESCYWITLKVFQQFSSLNVKRVDCFFYAREAAASPGRIFKCYVPGKTRLKTYAQYPLKTAIIERVRVGSQLLKYSSDPALMRATSRTLLKSVLYRADFSEERVNQCLLFWQCFREEYVPTSSRKNRKSPAPNEAQWRAIASAYNRRRYEFNLANPVTIKDVVSLLTICTKAIRDSLKIRILSGDEFPNLLDYNGSLLAREHEYLTEESSQLKNFLAKVFPEQPFERQQIVKLWMGLGLKQTEIAIALGWNAKQQYQVSRQFSRCQKELLKALVDWSKVTFNITLNPQQMQEIAPQIDDWLERFCIARFSQVLQQTIVTDLSAELSFLTAYYGQGLSREVVAQSWRISEEVFDAKITGIKQQLQAKLQSHVLETLQVDLKVIPQVETRLETFVTAWLTNAHYATFGR